MPLRAEFFIYLLQIFCVKFFFILKYKILLNIFIKYESIVYNHSLIKSYIKASVIKFLP
uniref:Uncharacterized protein n=1 Tax=Solanum lycopersicum TaxID=4081 RepID=A0A3Q7HV89_SOLLC